MNVVTQDLVKDTALREQIKHWTNQNTAAQTRPGQVSGEEVQLPEPVPLLTNTGGEAGSLTAPEPPLTSCGGVEPDQPGAASQTSEVEKVPPAIVEPVTSDEAAESVSEVIENIPENFIETITDVKEDIPEEHVIESSPDEKEDIPEEHLFYQFT